MKKIKNLSDEFVISIGLLLMSFFIFQAAVLPSVYKPTQTAGVIYSTKFDYEISKSRINQNAFNFKYQFLTPSVARQESFFDISIAPFNEANADRELGGDFVSEFGNIRDAWGYPVRENAFMTETRRGGDRSDEDPDVLGMVNCRANTDIDGYFKAYFEDVALGNGVGYDDPAFGEGRRNEACQVLQDISELIKLDESAVHLTPDIIFYADPGNIPPGALAGASSYFQNNANTPDNGFIHRHIISLIDPSPLEGMFDAFVLTNFDGVAWDVDSDLNPGTYDMYSVLYHEILHTLGFRGRLPAVITQTDGVFDHDTFDFYSYENDTLAGKFLDSTTFTSNAPIGAPSPWFTTNEVVYQGVKNIVGAVPDGIRPVYSPSGWQQGSSLSHFDMDRSNGETYIMHPSIGTDTERSINDHEKEVLCHLGYQVEGLPDCIGETPWANDDMVVVEDGSDTVCIKPLTNDGAWGTITMNTVALTDIQAGDVATYYPGINCNGNELSSPYGAHSISYQLSASLSPRVLTYTNKDNTSGRVSNIASIYIASLAECNSDEDEYICNGDFEMSFGDNHIHIACPNGWDPIASYSLYWCNYFADYTLTLNFDGNINLFSAINGNFFGDVNAGYPAAFSNKLKQPLIPGQEYVLSFDRFGTNTAEDLILGFNMQPVVHHPGTWYSDAEATPDQELISNTTSTEIVGTTMFNVPWKHYTINFVAQDSYESFIFGSTQLKYFLDNFSLKLASAVEEGDNSIQGKVYYDTDSDGQIDFGETGLNGIEVGLFEDGSTTPSETTLTLDSPDLGEYSFVNLVDGNYKVALIGESVYPTISEPTPNSLIAGYTHALSVDVSGGFEYGQNDFGVILSESNSEIFDLGVKKGLIDSTLSLTDRNITWSVEVTNYGPDMAENIDIVDHIPVPLIYYSHVTTPPNTFNPSTGIWHIPSLESGETALLYLVTKVPLGTCGVKINKANLESYEGIDTNVTNNGSQAQIKLRACTGIGTVFPTEK